MGGNGQGVNGAEPPIPDTCNEDIQKGMTASEVIPKIEKADQKRLSQAKARGTAGRVPGFINWRIAIGDHGRGETITIAQQLVYIGNVSYLTRRPRMCQIMNHLMDTDPDLAWGRMRFANGKSPDVTISLACYKPLLKRPCPKLCLDELI